MNEEDQSQNTSSQWTTDEQDETEEQSTNSTDETSSESSDDESSDSTSYDDSYTVEYSSSSVHSHSMVKASKPKKSKVVTTVTNASGSSDIQYSKEHGGFLIPVILLVLIAAAGYYVWKNYDKLFSKHHHKSNDAPIGRRGRRH